jgi:hypothetical protein
MPVLHSAGEAPFYVSIAQFSSSTNSRPSQTSPSRRRPPRSCGQQLPDRHMAAARQICSCGRIALRAARDDLQTYHRAKASAETSPRAMVPATKRGGEDHRHGLRMNRRHDRVGLGGEEAIDVDRDLAFFGLAHRCPGCPQARASSGRSSPAANHSGALAADRVVFAERGERH